MIILKKSIKSHVIARHIIRMSDLHQLNVEPRSYPNHSCFPRWCLAFVFSVSVNYNCGLNVHGIHYCTLKNPLFLLELLHPKHFVQGSFQVLTKLYCFFVVRIILVFPCRLCASSLFFAKLEFMRRFRKNILRKTSNPLCYSSGHYVKCYKSRSLLKHLDLAWSLALFWERLQTMDLGSWSCRSVERHLYWCVMVGWCQTRQFMFAVSQGQPAHPPHRDNLWCGVCTEWRRITKKKRVV